MYTTIDNKNIKLKDELLKDIKKGSKISIAASCFSIYAYQELKEALEDIDELRFIFTSPSFTKEKAEKEDREFYIPRLFRERSLYGNEFEIKLKNELNQKAIAKECADWIRRKVTFKSNTTSLNPSSFININNINYNYSGGFTTSDLGCEQSKDFFTMITKTTLDKQQSETNNFLNQFNETWNDKEKVETVTDKIIESITSAYKENSPDFIYYITLYNIFNEFLEDISEDDLPNESTGYQKSAIWKMLYNFQKDAAFAIINKLEKYNGCILADSVGLGKTFTALSVIKYYESRNKNVLVLCPKKLCNNWNIYKGNYTNNPIYQDRLRYDVLFHTDLSREKGTSNGLDLTALNWANYDLVVIDESHNFRNGGKIVKQEDDYKENRYLKLLNKVIKSGVKTKVLMLSATPVNNKFNDLKNQLQLAYEGDPTNINDKLDLNNSIDKIFKEAQTAFNQWSKLEEQDRTTEKLMRSLKFDFFELLDSVTIARSRKHIINYYDTSNIGAFPHRLKPKSITTPLTDIEDAINYNEIYKTLNSLNLSIYSPTSYIQPSKKQQYADLYEDNTINTNFTQASREKGIQKLTAINLLKRLESSISSFQLSVERILKQITDTIEMIDNYEKTKGKSHKFKAIELSNKMLDEEDIELDSIFAVGKKIRIDLADMDYASWRTELKLDQEELSLLLLYTKDIDEEHDCKLQKLLSIIKDKIEHPINEGNRKIIIFTAFADTAEYLYNAISKKAKEKFGIDSAMVSGSVEGKTTLTKIRKDLNTVLTFFSPISKDREMLMPNSNENIDLLIATDCISEGQNLQDCDFLINYDIHWNPVRIIQRFGRIDRIGSRNNQIQLVNFWPNLSLDEYINLKAKVETKMKIVNMTATGDENLLSDENKVELEYRKKQLQRLKDEVVDLEDMSSGISITDLGLNEFRLDLLAYNKDEKDIDKAPHGLSAVVSATEQLQPGVIYVLKNRTDNINIDNKNRLHPFYMVYISDKGEIIINHLAPKRLLDIFRLLCKGKDKPIPTLYKAFNKETQNGKKMDKYSGLLNDSIASIINIGDEITIDDIFAGTGSSLLNTNLGGIDDFELITFLIIK